MRKCQNCTARTEMVVSETYPLFPVPENASAHWVPFVAVCVSAIRFLADSANKVFHTVVYVCPKCGGKRTEVRQIPKSTNI